MTTDADTALVNAAFAWLGEDPVAGLELTPAPSRVVKILPHVQAAIDAVLVKYGWLCALEYGTLEPSGLIPANWRFGYAYTMPEGGLRFWTVERVTGWERGVWENPTTGASTPILRAVEGGSLKVAWVKRRKADALSAPVHDAAALELAARACRSIGGSVERALELRKLADDAALSAMGTDGQDARADDVMLVDRLAELRAGAA